MSRVRSKNTDFEKSVITALKKSGLKFKTHYKVIGKPDIAIPKDKKAVFLDSDFWHGWRFSQWESKLTSDFWRDKIRANITRDKKVVRLLKKSGWSVLRIREYGLKNNFSKTIAKITIFLND